MTAERSPLDKALDLLVYAPVGLALTARENLPGMVDKGRRKVADEVGLAKMIGQFAVQKGGHEARKLAEKAGALLSGGAPPAPAGAGGRVAGRAEGGAGARAPGPVPADPEPAVGPVPADPEPAVGPVPADPEPAAGPMSTPPAPHGPSAASPVEPPVEPEVGPSGVPPVPAAAAPALTHARPGGTAGSSAHLAIPGYDALSASQVVQRLAGLTPEELEAVDAYERSTRGRRTVLNRAAQLRPGPSS